MLHAESRLLVQHPFVKQEIREEGNRHQFSVADFTSRAGSPPSYLESASAGLNIHAGQSFISTVVSGGVSIPEPSSASSICVPVSSDFSASNSSGVSGDFLLTNTVFSGVPTSRSSSTGSGSDPGSSSSSGGGANSTRRKAYGCDLCPAMFGSKMELEEHSNSHTGEKPFECDVCNARFNRRSTLWNHKRIHSDQKPFRCPICAMHFKWKNSLKCHKEMHLRKNETGPLDAEEFRIQLLSPSKRGRTARGGSRKRGGSATAAASSNISVSPLVNGHGASGPGGAAVGGGSGGRPASPDFSMLEDPTGYSATSMNMSQDQQQQNGSMPSMVNGGVITASGLMENGGGGGEQAMHQTTYHTLTTSSDHHLSRHPGPGISQENGGPHTVGSAGSPIMQHHSMPQHQPSALAQHHQQSSHDNAHPHLIHHLAAGGTNSPSPSTTPRPGISTVSMGGAGSNGSGSSGGGGHQSILQQVLQHPAPSLAVHHQAASVPQLQQHHAHHHQQQPPEPAQQSGGGPSYQIYVQNLPDVKPAVGGGAGGGLLQPISSVAPAHHPHQPHLHHHLQQPHHHHQHAMTSSYNHHPAPQPQGHQVVITAGGSVGGSMKLSPPTGAIPLQTSRGESPIASGGTVRHTSQALMPPASSQGGPQQHLIQFLTSTTSMSASSSRAGLGGSPDDNNNAMMTTMAPSSGHAHMGAQGQQHGSVIDMNGGGFYNHNNNHNQHQNHNQTHQQLTNGQSQSMQSTPAPPRLTGLEQFAASLLNPPANSSGCSSPTGAAGHTQQNGQHCHSPSAVAAISQAPQQPQQQVTANGVPPPQHNGGGTANGEGTAPGRGGGESTGDYMPNVDFMTGAPHHPQPQPPHSHASSPVHPQGATQMHPVVGSSPTTGGGHLPPATAVYMNGSSTSAGHQNMNGGGGTVTYASSPGPGPTTAGLLNCSTSAALTAVGGATSIASLLASSGGITVGTGSSASTPPSSAQPAADQHGYVVRELQFNEW